MRNLLAIVALGHALLALGCGGRVAHEGRPAMEEQLYRCPDGKTFEWREDMIEWCFRGGP